MPRKTDQDEWYERERLHRAAADGDVTEVRCLIAAGYDVNAFDEGTELTPLHYTAEGEHYAVMRVLLDAGADIMLMSQTMPETRPCVMLLRHVRRRWHDFL